MREQERFLATSIKGVKNALKMSSVIEQLGDENIGSMGELVARCEPIVSRDGVVDFSNLGEDQIPVFVSLRDNSASKSEEIEIEMGGNNVFTNLQESGIPEQLGVIGIQSSFGMIKNIFYQNKPFKRSLSSFENGLSFGIHKLNTPVDTENILEGPLVSVVGRPGLMFPFKPNSDKRIEPDIFAHELTHVRQKESRPVRYYSCQEDIDMDGLADEMEAYFVGSAVRRAISNLTQERLELLDLLNPETPKREKYFQITVDQIRLRHGNTEEPFSPTNELLDVYSKKYGISRRGMISGWFDIDEARKVFAEQMEQVD